MSYEPTRVATCIRGTSEDTEDALSTVVAAMADIVDPDAVAALAATTKRASARRASLVASLTVAERTAVQKMRANRPRPVNIDARAAAGQLELAESPFAKVAPATIEHVRGRATIGLFRKARPVTVNGLALPWNHTVAGG